MERSALWHQPCFVSCSFLLITTGCALPTPVTQREQSAGIGGLIGGGTGAIIGSVTGMHWPAASLA
jgi:hypothetical protein